MLRIKPQMECFIKKPREDWVKLLLLSQPNAISVLMYNGGERAIHRKMGKFNTTLPCKVSKCIC